jgi:hypothetical protein
MLKHLKSKDYVGTKSIEADSVADFRMAFICSDSKTYNKILKKLQSLEPWSWNDLAENHNDSTGNLSGKRISFLNNLCGDYTNLKHLLIRTDLERNYNLSPIPTKQDYKFFVRQGLDAQEATILKYAEELNRVIPLVEDEERREQFANELVELTNQDPLAGLTEGWEEASYIINNSSKLVKQANKDLKDNGIDPDNQNEILNEKREVIEKANKRINAAKTKIRKALGKYENPKNIRDAREVIRTAEEEIQQAKAMIDFINSKIREVVKVNQVKKAFETKLNQLMLLRNGIINEIIQQEIENDTVY